VPNRIPTGRLVPPLLLVYGFALATHSVPRYRPSIVVGYTVLAVLLAGWLWRGGGRVELARPIAAGVLAVTGVAVLRVHSYTYLDNGPAHLVRIVFASTAIGAALLFCTRWRHAGPAAAALGIVGHVVGGVLLIHDDPAPRIDVWYTLQGAADALGSGQNPYTQVWTSSWTVMESFTYLPWTAVLLAPGRWLAGDVRWTLLVLDVLTAVLVALLPVAASRGAVLRVRPRGGPAVPAAAPGDTGPTGATGPAVTQTGPTGRGVTDREVTDRGLLDASGACAVLLLVLPGTPTQVEQAWTEPLLLACVVGALTAVLRGHRRLALVLLALSLASKQHMALLLPLLAAWRWAGPRAAAAVGAGAGALVLPWFLMDPGAIWHDTVQYLVDFPPIKFADTLYIAAIRHLSWQPPFWFTGAIVLGCMIGICLGIRRTDPGPAQLLRWCSLMLLLANLVNKQAFYNQFWLAGALLLLSWAVPQDLEPVPPAPAGPGARSGRLPADGAGGTDGALRRV